MSLDRLQFESCSPERFEKLEIRNQTNHLETSNSHTRAADSIFQRLLTKKLHFEYNRQHSRYHLLE